jgi:pimeloyl-ACP methyl ester carboxylesterase
VDNQQNPFDTYHIALVTYDEKGRPMADAPFTATSDTKRHAVIVPPDKVIPVIFVPGIMGSNLKLKVLPEGFVEKQFMRSDVAPKVTWRGLSPIPTVEPQRESWGDFAWRPDDSLFMAQKFWALEAYERRRLLSPNNTLVDDRADLEAALGLFSFETGADGREARGKERKQGFVREMRRRGWGTVMVSSYGPLLGFLEQNLNHMYWLGQLDDFWSNTIISRKRGSGGRAPKYDPVDWGIVKGDKSLTADDVKKAARYWLPVHAVGYNWLESNLKGATHLVGKIDEFTSHYRALGYECEKVILVTHSMGGLVARAAVHPELGGAQSKVLGVIHGVMPTRGAAAAYRRCHAGFEGGSYTSKGGITAKILGEDGPEVAAVFSNSPGALQLLPSKGYGTGWLKISTGDGKPPKALPETDPYKEIYSEKDAWWRLMNPEWVNPVPRTTPEILKNGWERYLDNIDKAEAYHEKVKDSRHPHTHIHYGADAKDYVAFGSIRWHSSSGGNVAYGDPLNPISSSESKHGAVSMREVWVRTGRSTAPAQYKMAAQDEAGDGTVPRRSGAALHKVVECVAEHTGYDHQGSYQDRRTQELVAYGVVRLISENA